MNTSARKYLLLGTLLVAVSGCSPHLVKVTGRVTYHGQPVPSTLVTFYPDEEGGRPCHAVTGDDGTFALNYSRTQEGAMQGSYTVFLKYHPSADEELGKSPHKASAALKEVIARYGDLKSSNLHYDVTKNGQFIEINLE